MKPNLTATATLALTGLLALPAAAAGEGIFPDKQLEAAVRKQVFEKRDNDQPITAEDVKNISTIRGAGMGITDLTGLEHCTALASLDLARNEIQDLSPIANLRRVQLLDLADNKVSDLSALETMKALQYVNIEGNRVTTIAPLASLENLNSLYASGNAIATIPQGGFPKLWTLDVGDNQIASLAGFSGFPRLDTLRLDHNRISDLAPLVEWRAGAAHGSRLEVSLAGNPLDAAGGGDQVAALAEDGVRVAADGRSG